MLKPFLKWTGGKRQLLPVIKEFIPKQFDTYYEPFVGAGAVLFSMQPQKAIINDVNSELINCYHAIAKQPEELIALCQKHKESNSQDYYYKMRSLDRCDDFNKLSAVERAARIIYLNKTCFNGLFRVNSKGQFNVPFGSYQNPTIAEEEAIKTVSKYLNKADVSIEIGDFEDTVSTCNQGDFIYFDPPYHPLSDTSSFTGYSADGFTQLDQVRLRDICNNLVDRGCQVLISNSDTEFIRSLYSNSRYEIIEVKASRAINSVASKRGKINELLIRNQGIYGFRN
jgi:DNA adenine methylase